ncbi:MAG: alpha/beta hydrolase [Gammaproteobacteria bacterium]|nr:alpha/beta hydrolase [Gammaproteobacteria bacterium]
MTTKELKQVLMLSDGTSVTYRLTRPGSHRRLVILIHGAASNMSRWSEFIEHTTLGQDWDILRLDLRGHGESTWRGLLDLSTWSRDICEILDRERYQDAVIIGHSLGAQVAMDMGMRYPSRVAGLVLIDPVFYDALYPRYKWFYRSRWITRPLIWLGAALNRLGIHRRHVRNRDLRLLDESTRKKLLAVGKGEEMAKFYGSPWPDLKHFPAINYFQELYLSIKPVANTGRLRIPLLAILSTTPTYTRTGITAEIVSGLARGEIAHVDAYHWPLTEKPEQTRLLIEQWCSNTFISSHRRNGS